MHTYPNYNKVFISLKKIGRQIEGTSLPLCFLLLDTCRINYDRIKKIKLEVIQNHSHPKTNIHHQYIENSNAYPCGLDLITKMLRLLNQ